jgi:hypothetical protein
MTTTTARKATTTTIELDAELVAKLRASVRAVRKNKTLEEFVEELLADMLEPHSGLFEGLIENEHRREKIELKLDRIRRGDSRLVRSEPVARNTVVYTAEMERLKKIAGTVGMPVNSAINSLLYDSLNDIESGKMKFVLTSSKGGLKHRKNVVRGVAKIMGMDENQLIRNVILD